MTTAYTSLLGLALPVTGELDGTWGDTVNNYITEYTDASIAGAQTISGSQTAVTLSKTTGSSLSQAGSGATGSSQYQIINCTGNPASLLTITAPATSKTYIVINATSTSQSVKIVGVGPTTGVTISSGEKAIIAWNGSDFVKVASSTATGDVVGPASATDNAIARFDGTTGKLIQNSSVIVADDGSMVISTNSSTNALRITQTGAGNALSVEDSANPDSTPFVVDANGTVIVGGSQAFSSSGITGPSLNVITTISGAGAGISSWVGASTGAGNFQFMKSRGASAGTYTLVSDGDSLGIVRFSGADGANFISAATITASVDGTPGTNDMPGRLVFSTTADGASSPTERMRIDNAGQVGIGGTPSAGQTLRISKNITGATTGRGALVTSTVQSDVTSVAYGYSTFLSTQAAAFTLPVLSHYHAQQGTIGAGSTATTQYGYFADASLTGATNNYGFYSSISSGTGRWNFYANGTAENFFGGVTTFRAANAVRVEAASTQDAIVIAGRAGGTSSYAVTLTPTTLSASRTVTLPDANTTVPVATQVLTFSGPTAARTLTLPDSNFTVGYQNIPYTTDKTSSYILATGDVGKVIGVGTGGSITIPDATFAAGDAVLIFNNTTGAITITCTITTAYIAGTDSDKATVSLATRGVANILFVSGTVCVITGNVS